MKIRYLASFHEVNVSQPIRSTNGQLMAFTQRQPNGVFAAVLTRAQWDELRRTRWACPVLDTSFLIPDVDFQAEDGRTFATLEECIAHEDGDYVSNLGQHGLTAPKEEPNPPADPAALDTALEAAIVKAVSSKSLLVADLAHLGASKDEIKAVMKQTKWLRWAGPRICLAKTSLSA